MSEQEPFWRSWKAHWLIAFVVGLVVVGIGAAREWVPHGFTMTLHQIREALAWGEGLLWASLAGMGVIALVAFLTGGKDE